MPLDLGKHFADTPECLCVFEAFGNRLRSAARSRRSSKIWRRPADCYDDSSMSTYHGWAAGSRSRQPDARCSTSSIPNRGISLKLLTLLPAASPAISRIASIVCGDEKPTTAVSIERGRGTTCSTAAVITPSVPSASMNRFFRSWPVLSFFSLLRFLKYLSVCEHYLNPKHM